MRLEALVGGPEVVQEQEVEELVLVPERVVLEARGELRRELLLGELQVGVALRRKRRAADEVDVHPAQQALGGRGGPAGEAGADDASQTRTAGNT